MKRKPFFAMALRVMRPGPIAAAGPGFFLSQVCKVAGLQIARL